MKGGESDEMVCSIDRCSIDHIQEVYITGGSSEMRQSVAKKLRRKAREQAPDHSRRSFYQVLKQGWNMLNHKEKGELKNG